MSNEPLHDSPTVPLWKSAIEEPVSLQNEDMSTPAEPIVETAVEHLPEEMPSSEPSLVETAPVDQEPEAALEVDAPPPIDSRPLDSRPPIDDPAQGYHLTIHELPQDLRPRERLAYAGPASLSTAELLAIILRTGGRGENVLRMSERVLTHFGGMKGLGQANFQELCNIHGVGEAKAAQIQSALELGKRLLVAAPNELPRIHTPIDIANMLMLEMGLLEQEQLRVVLLDSRNQVLRISTVYSGNLNMAVVRVGEIFRDAIRANSAAIILVHNHPSGDPRPSPEDTQTTRMVVDAGILLDIEVLDHLIIGDRCYVSMKEKGLGF